MMFIDCWWLLLRGSKYLEHIPRIRTEYLLNNMNTEHSIKQWITEMNSTEQIEQ